MDKKMKSCELIIALDTEGVIARRVVDTLGEICSWYKVGPSLVLEDPDILRFLKSLGKSVMLDLKFHDIPRTVERACQSASNMGVDMMTVHAAGGLDMMQAAKQGAGSSWVLGVTVLTSVGERGGTTGKLVKSLAGTVQDAGLDGVVCSVLEAGEVRGARGRVSSLIIATPGIRLPSGEADDHARKATPHAAGEAGADFIIVGRPILQAPSVTRAAALFARVLH